jgi:hypothetical protein
VLYLSFFFFGMNKHLIEENSKTNTLTINKIKLQYATHLTPRGWPSGQACGFEGILPSRGLVFEFT